MIAAFNSAAAGLVDASNTFAKVANRTVVESALASEGFTQLLEGQSGAAKLAGTKLIANVPLRGTTLYTPSYAEDVLATRQATAAYRASAKVFKVATEITDELIKSVR